MGPNAENNTIVGLRNENSINQVVADPGSSYNNWVSGGTMFTGQLTDNGTRNSFLDTFHRSFNGLNGDWYGSQNDATVTNHFRLGTGTGNERGMLNRYQTDFGYRWTIGLSDATAGEQFYQLLDELNNVFRLSIGQYNNGQASSNNQTVINAAGTGAIVLNGSTNAGTGGVVFGSGGASGTTIATINNAGNAQFNGSLQVGGPSTFNNSTTVKNQADAEIDSFLWAGATTSQKESFIYKDYTGASQWYMVKDASNNWALNSATGGLDSFKAYQSTNSGDTYINASNSSGVVRVNYETGSGAGFNIYGGNSGTLYAGFTGPAAIKFPGLAASSGHNCLQIDSSGYLSNTGANCGTGTGSGTVNAGFTGQIAYYNGNGAAVSGMNSVPLSAGGTGATTAAAALTNMGAQPVLPGVSSDGASGVQVTGNVTTTAAIASGAPLVDIRHPSYNGGTTFQCDGVTDIGPKFQAAYNANNMNTNGGEIIFVGSPFSCYWANPTMFNWGTNGHPNKALTIKVEGALSLGTTLNDVTYLNIIGASGGGVAQFATGQGAVIVGPNTTGTLGTAVTAGSSQTFTPSTMTGIYPGTGLTVIDQLTCTGASASRANNLVTASFSSGCHIPSGANAIISGCSDSSFNGTFLVTGDDYVVNTMNWSQTATNSTATGCTVSGLNEDTVETVPITATSGTTTGSTATAYFAFAHPATAQWGIVGLEITGSQHLVKDITVQSSGTAFWLYKGTLTTMENTANGVQGVATAFPVEYDQSFWDYQEHCQFLNWDGATPWSILMTNSQFDGNNVTGFINDHNGVIKGGIKMERGARAFSAINTIFERATRAAVVMDNRMFSSAGTTAPNNNWFFNTGLQDNFNNYTQQCLINSEYGSASWDGQIAGMYNPANTSCVMNDYYLGSSDITSSGGAQFGTTTSRGIVGSYRDGHIIEGDFRSRGANFEPSIIPHASLPVPQNPSSWTGSCTTTLVNGPDNYSGNPAGQLTSATSGVDRIYSYSVTPQNGDHILYGVWFRLNEFALPVIGNGPLTIDNFASTHFQFDNTTLGYAVPYDAHIVGDGWRPLIGLSTVTGADGTAGIIRLNLSCQSGATANYWMPFMYYIPASENIPANILQQWAQETSHGWVPTAGTPGLLYALDPIVLPADPTSGPQAATKNYVDAHTAFTPLVLDFTTSSSPSGIGCTGSGGNYTCTSFPTASHICTIYAIGGGAGGGSGAVEPSGTNAYGGGGGSGGESQILTVPCNMLGGGTSATITVGVGAGGAGGTAQSSSSSNGNSGVYGAPSYVSGASGYVSVRSGGGTNSGSSGSGGTNTTGTGGTATYMYTPFGFCSGANGSNSTGSSPGCYNGLSIPLGGAGGGGVNTTPTAAAGGAMPGYGIQQSRVGVGTGSVTGNTGGAAGGGAGQTPAYSTAVSTTEFFLGALGGTGGGGNTSGNGGAGGAGMFPGGGGGGGGAALNGSSSGAGGAGGNGFVRIIVQ